MRAKAIAAMVVFILFSPEGSAQRLPLPDPNAVIVVKDAVPTPAPWRDIQAVAGRLTTLKSLNGQSLKWELVSDAPADLVPAADGKTAAFVAPKDGVYKVLAYSCAKDGETARIRVIVGTAPQPPPDEPDIVPPPVVKSFRVIFVAESGVTLPVGQQAVMDAKAVRDYLTANTTPEGGLAGWRQYDPQVNTAREQPTMKALWAAVQSKITALPCLVVEVNGKADILPFPANATAALATLKQYKEGK